MGALFAYYDLILLNMIKSELTIFTILYIPLCIFFEKMVLLILSKIALLARNILDFAL